MPDVPRELCNEGEVSRLPGGPIRRAGQRECQRLVVCENSEVPAFYEVSEMLDGFINSEQFPVEGGVFLLCWSQRLGEEGYGPPALMFAPLRQLGADGNVGGVDGETGLGEGGRVMQQDSIRQCPLGSSEGVLCSVGPGDLFGLAGCCDCRIEGAEGVADSREEPPVVVQHPQEPLQGDFGPRCGELLQVLDSPRQGVDACGVGYVPQILDFLPAEDALAAVQGDALQGEQVEDFSEVPLVLRGAGAGDQDVVKVDEGEGYVAEDPIH